MWRFDQMVPRQAHFQIFKLQGHTENYGVLHFKTLLFSERNISTITKKNNVERFSTL